MRKTKQQTIKDLKDTRIMQLANIVMNQALKTGKMQINCTEMVRYNNPGNGEGPNPDGKFDIEGLSSSDVQCRYKFAWWMPSNWSQVFKEMPQYLSHIKEMIIDDFVWLVKNRRFKSLLQRIKTWVFDFSPFAYNQKGWVWVVSSLSSAIADEAFEKVLRNKKNLKISSSAFQRKVEDLIEKNGKELRDMALSNMIEITPYLWANADDATVFILDEKHHPYDLKDGWSEEAIAEAIKIWVKCMYEKDIQVLVGEEK